MCSSDLPALLPCGTRRGMAGRARLHADIPRDRPIHARERRERGRTLLQGPTPRRIGNQRARGRLHLEVVMLGQGVDGRPGAGEKKEDHGP